MVYLDVIGDFHVHLFEDSRDTVQEMFTEKAENPRHKKLTEKIVETASSLKIRLDLSGVRITESQHLKFISSLFAKYPAVFQQDAGEST